MSKALEKSTDESRSANPIPAGSSPWFRMDLPLLGVALAAAIIFFGKLGSVPLFNPDEGLYAEPAREMLETGQYLTTLLNYNVRFTKPPLVIWAMALSYRAFGVNEFSARIFVATCAFALVLVTYLFAQRFFDRKTACLSAFILITSPLFIAVGHEAITDMPLSLFMAGSIMSFFYAFKDKKTWAKWLGYVLVALSIMTKGPVGLLLPVLIMVAYFYLRGQLRESYRFFSVPLGLCLVSLIALPWFVLEIAATKGAYFNEFILRENFARFTSVVDSHKGPPWYHLAVVMAGLFPWSFLLPQICKEGWLSLSRFAQDESVKADSVPIKNASLSLLQKVWIRLQDRLGMLRLRRLDQKEEALLLCGLSVIVTIGFFSASVSKLLPYTLPAFPALAIIIGAYLTEVLAHGKAKTLLIPSIAIALSYGGVAFLAPILVGHLREAPLGIVHIVEVYSACTFVALLLAVALATYRGLLDGIFAFALSLFLLTCICGTVLLPELSRAFEEDTTTYAEIASHSPCPLLLFDVRKPGITFYYHRQVILPADFDELVDDLQRYDRAYVITKGKHCSRLLKRPGIKIIKQGQKFAFLLWQK
jgi:4-amino-4-deoxy-L-arabinose transferase-like glycosyltransferase